MANDDFKKIGAGWKKTSKAGNTYLSLLFDAEAIKGMDLTAMNVMVFPVKEKKNPKSPDYNINATEKQPRQQTQQKPNVRNYAPRTVNQVEDDDF